MLLLRPPDDSTASTSTVTTTTTTSVDVPSLYDDDMDQIRHTLVRDYILPKFQAMYESSHWDPMDDEREIGLNLYEWLIDIIVRHDMDRSSVAPPTATVDNDGTDEVLFPNIEKKESSAMALANLVTKQLVHSVVYNKILRTLNHSWKPKWDEQHGFVHRPDLWIVPWLPYLATDKSLMPTLVSDCKRAVKNAISYLHRTIPSNRNDLYIQICWQSLRGWIGILKLDTLRHIMSAGSVVSRLALYLSNCQIHIDDDMVSSSSSSSSTFVSPTPPSNHWTSAVRTLFQYHQLQLISDVQFLSLFEGELLPHWADAMYQYMSQSLRNTVSDAKVTDDGSTLEIVCRVYTIWKRHIFGGMNDLTGAIDANGVVTSNDDVAVSPSHLLLRADIPICECFYSVLEMLSTYYKVFQCNAANCSESSNTRNDTGPFNALRFATPGYRSVYHRRNDKLKQQASDDLLRMNLSGMAGATTFNGERPDQTAGSVLDAQVRLHQSQSKDIFSSNGPSFRDVVAEFAREHDLLFQPRLNSGVGATTTKDGKAIYLFGTIPIYLDHNVAYAYTKTTSTTTTNREWQPMSLNDIAILAKQHISEQVERSPQKLSKNL